jgi:hypothetical protein
MRAIVVGGKCRPRQQKAVQPAERRSTTPVPRRENQRWGERQGKGCKMHACAMQLVTAEHAR